MYVSEFSKEIEEKVLGLLNDYNNGREVSCQECTDEIQKSAFAFMKLPNDIEAAAALQYLF